MSDYASSELHRRSHPQHGFDKYCPACVDGNGNVRTRPCPRCSSSIIWDDDPGCDSCGLILGDSEDA